MRTRRGESVRLASARPRVHRRRRAGSLTGSHLASFSLYYGGGALVTFTVIRLGVTLPGSIMRQRADGLTRSAVGILAAERPTAPLDRGER